MKLETQKIQRGDSWSDESGNFVDKKRLFSHEVKAERSAVRIFNMALQVQEILSVLAEDADKSSEEIRLTHLKHKDPDLAKKEEGNPRSFTFWSFNKDIKIEKVIIPLFGYEEEEVALCKKTFEEFLNEYGEKEDKEAKVLKDLVMSAFTTKRGRFDSKKLDSLLSYKEKIKDEKFQEAVKILEGSRHEKKTKPYFNIYYKDDVGTYVQLNLRLSGAY